MRQLPRAYLLYPATLGEAVIAEQQQLREQFLGCVDDWQLFEFCHSKDDKLSPQWYPCGSRAWFELRGHLALWEHALSTGCTAFAVVRAGLRFLPGPLRLFCRAVPDDSGYVAFVPEGVAQQIARGRCNADVQTGFPLASRLAYAMQSQATAVVYEHILRALAARDWPHPPSFLQLTTDAVWQSQLTTMCPVRPVHEGIPHAAV